MYEIHLIERVGNFSLVDKENNIWDSYAWILSDNIASRLVGSKVYFHKFQDKPSFFGGSIVSYERLSNGEDQGRVVIRFKATKEFKDVRTTKDGWAMEMKIVPYSSDS